PPGAVAIQPLPVAATEDWPLTALTDGQVDRPGGARRERDGDDLAALAGNYQGPVPALDAQGPDVGTDGFGHPQPVEGQQRDERVLGGRARRRPTSRRARCGPARWRVTHSPGAGGGHERRASAQADLPRRRSGRTRPRCTAAG